METPAAVSVFEPVSHRALLMSVGADQGEELGPGGGFAELAVQCRGDCRGAGGRDAANRHAQVLGLDDDTDTAGCDLFLEPVGDLLGQSFLHLGAAGEQLDNSGQLGQAEYPVPGEIADVGHPDERQQVVLAH